MTVVSIPQAKIKTSLGLKARVLRFPFNPSNHKISFKNPEQVLDHLMPRLRFLKHEEFWVFCLDSKNNLIHEEMISKGSLTGSVVHPREVFNVAIMHRCAAILVAHNHPSGCPRPSNEDLEVTKMLVDTGKILRIPVHDHFIIGDGTYYSFFEEGRL